MPLLIAPGGQRVGRRVSGIKLHRLAQQPQCDVIILRRLGKGGEHRAQGQVIGIVAGRRLAPDAFDFRAAQYRTDCTDDALGDAVLQIE